ncbi:hypothetical protein B0H14DRAFT_3573082 [Mycena olivaceomarginata]|nr:hypothetical protein B0H14DRAFT_3573082 [Mycena olivaceomarginata]
MNNNTNGKHETSSWSHPTMAEFCGSSPARPWVLDATSALVLQSNKPLKKFINFPSTIRPDVGVFPLPEPLRAINPHVGGGRQNTTPAICSTRQKIAGPPRRSPRTRGTESQPLPPVTFPAITPPLERRVDFSAAPFPFVSPAITPPLERQVNFSAPRLPSHLSVPVTHHATSGTLRSGKEFSLHGAIILDNFDVFDHVQTARVRNDNIIENALDDHPITVPSGRSRSLSPRRATSGSLCTRSQSALLVLLGLWTSQLTAAAAPAQHTVPIDKNFSALSTRLHGDVYGIRDKPANLREYGLNELTDHFGMQIVQWDGRSSRPLVDRKGRVIAVLGGRPNDPEYLRLTKEAANHLESTCELAPEFHLAVDNRSQAVGDWIPEGEATGATSTKTRKIDDVT